MSFRLPYAFRSLKVRIAFWATTAMVVLGLAGTSVALWMVRENMRHAAAESQSALVSSIASDLDHRINDRRAALMLSASVLGPLELTDPAALHEHISGRPVVLGMFDMVFVTDASGRIIFDTPMFPGRAGRSVSDREYFQQAMATGHTVISQPIAGRATSEPNVVFAAPLRARDGRITGALCGVVFLSRSNFLSQLVNLRIGDSGHVMVIAKSDKPVYVMHGQADRLMATLDAADLTEPTRRALAGFEGSVEARTPQGLDAINSYRSLRSVPWVLAISYPTGEVYAPLRALQLRIVLIAAVLTVGAGAGLWLVMRRLLAPLDRLREAMVEARSQVEPSRVAISDATREVQEVVDAYNALTQHNAEVSAALKTNKRKMRLITDNLPAMINYIDADMRYGFVNAHFARELGGPPEQFVGRPVSELRQALWETIKPHLERALRGEVVRFEGRAPRHGKLRDYQTTYVPDIGPDGIARGVFAMTLDITERKNAERQLGASEQRLRDVTNSVPALIGYFDRDERCQFANDTALRIHRIRREDLSSHTLRSAVGDEAYFQQAAAVRKALDGEASSVEGCIQRKGKDVYFQAHFVPDRGESGEVRGFYLMTFDITALKRAEQARAEGEQRLRTITDNLPALISYIDAQERVQFANATYGLWLGTDTAGVQGKTLREVLGEELYAQRESYLQQALQGRRVSFDVESVMLGVLRFLHVVYVPDVRSDGRVAGLYVLSSDVTPLKKVEQQLIQLARVDSLTSLPNRRSFDERLAEALARHNRGGRSMGLMFLDVDHFKRINDTHGHGIGDAVLKEFARRLQGCVRMSDLVARFAGDEFVVILEDLKGRDQAEAMAQKIGEVMRVPFVLDGLVLSVTSSIGVVYLGSTSLAPGEVVTRADAALYEAKRAGRDRHALVVC